jgi:hypothetical protein
MCTRTTLDTCGNEDCSKIQSVGTISFWDIHMFDDCEKIQESEQVF